MEKNDRFIWDQRYYYNMNESYQNKEWLEEQYLTKERTMKDIAKECNIDATTLPRWLKKFKIPMRTLTEVRLLEHKDREYQDRRWLRYYYIDLDLTITEIAETCECSESTIWRWLKIHEIPIKKKIAWNKGTKGVMKPNSSSFKKGKENPRYNNRETLRGGYKYIYYPKHPRSDKDGYTCEHLLVMENHIGRKLWKWEVIHHINGNKLDNRIENLYLCSSNKEHGILEAQLRKLAQQLIQSNKFGRIRFNRKECNYYIEYLDESDKDIFI